MKSGTITEFFKHLRTRKPMMLSVQYDICNVNINLLKKNEQGITSSTFNKLMSPKFAVDNNHDESGLRITTLIDKKTGKPVRAFVARVEANVPSTEEYCIMLEDSAGELIVQNKRYRVVGNTYFYIDRNKQMVAPKFEQVLINDTMYEKVFSYMKSTANKDYAGIGTRLHQIRIERMLQNNLGNSLVVAKGNSFPFHYSMGYRLPPATRPINDSYFILQEFSEINKQSPKYNTKYLFAEQQGNVFVIDWSATLGHFLYDYYKNGGAPLDDFLPNMYLNATSLKQWIAMIQKQPILY
ncbi:MAG: hypothetical protein J6W40_00370 [Alphaproteobacteria bacterium]|nr:hypothetical protein [Alphaproteobacteria bacterium]